MVWGCFTWWHAGPLHLIDGILRKEDYLQIFQTNITNFIEKCAYPETEIIFQQDGDPKHTAKIIKEWIGKQNFKLMEWTAKKQNPDLNTIENIWSIVKKRLGQYEAAPSNMANLWERIEESMPNRVQEDISNKSLWTKS